MSLLRIETGIPIPKTRLAPYGNMQVMRDAFLSMKVGDSFIYSSGNRHPYLAAKQVGCKIKTQKIHGVGWRIWRIK